MMRRLFLIGLLLLGPVGASASLYDDIKETVEEERLENELDDDVVSYLALVFEQPENAIEETLKGNFTQACDLLKSGRGECEELAIRIVQTAKQEMSVRKFGREAQEIASGEEVPVSYIPGRPISLFFDLSALLNLWTPGDEKQLTIGGDMGLYTKGVNRDDNEELYDKIDELTDILNGLDPEQYAAAIWRYDAGVRLVRSERNPDFPPPFVTPDSGPGTERQFLFKRWNDEDKGENIEGRLKDIYDLLPDDNDGIPNLVTYFVFSLEGTFFRDNTLIWARKGGKEKPGGGTIDYGDVGLGWNIPMTPVLPSLFTYDDEGAVNGFIPGGKYPPEPVDAGSPPQPLDGRKLCTDPVLGKGYLCSPQEDDECPVPDDIDPEAINLINCKTSSGSLTTAGADICRDLEWRSTPAHDRNDSAYDPDSQCYASLECVSSEFTGGITKAKEADGKIPVQLNPEPNVPSTYYAIHELVHAGQQSNLPLGYKLYRMNEEGDDLSEEPEDVEYNMQVCCTFEGEAYRAQCEAMEADGIFTRPDGSRYELYGVPLDVTSCAETYTDFSCNQRIGGRCPRSREYPATLVGSVPNEALFTSVMEAFINGNNVADVPASCEDATNLEKMDPRVKAKLKEVNAQYRVTDPDHTVTYRGTLGNNMCYVGQSIEESLEMHNITHQRSPAGVLDEKNPFQNAFDDVPRTEFPLIDVPLSNIPAYKPRDVIGQLDAAICERQGLPPLSPSILCSAQYLRRLQLPIADFILNTDSLMEQQLQGNVSARNYDSLSAGIGGRIATGIYERYGPRVIGPLMSLLKEAVAQLKLLPAIPFPEDMCPVGVP